MITCAMHIYIKDQLHATRHSTLAHLLSFSVFTIEHFSFSSSSFFVMHTSAQHTVSLLILSVERVACMCICCFFSIVLFLIPPSLREFLECVCVWMYAVCVCVCNEWRQWRVCCASIVVIIYCIGWLTEYESV